MIYQKLKKGIACLTACAMTAATIFLPVAPAFAKSTATTPIYRLYNPNNGEHLYTSSAHEKDVLYSSHGWGYEGIAWYAPKNTGKPVYRLYNPGLNNHLYTTDENEVRVLTSQHGWVKDFDGKPLFYSAGKTPIYRVYNAGLSGMHHLTTDRNEYNILPQYGWSQEGAKLYASKLGKPIKTKYANQNSSPAPASGSATISNTASYAAIEADVTLNGTGGGSHAKLVICTASSAISLGLQYDVHAINPYGGKTMVMVENVESNAPGGQQYDRPQNREVALGQTCHLMLTYNQDGTCGVYLNGEHLANYHNSGLSNSAIYMRVEGSARMNGDSVTAQFRNIKIKDNGVYDPNKAWGTYEFNTCPTIRPSIHAWNSIDISGTVSGLPAGGDWDSYYGIVSDIIQFTN